MSTNEDNKEEVEIVSVDVMDVDQKLQEIRADVPFIKNVIKAHRRDLNECQYTKLEKLVHLLGQNGKVSMTSLHKIENVIGKLKARFSLLLTPVETIDISHSNSAASTLKQQIPPTPTQTNPRISTSASDSIASLTPREITAKFKSSLSTKEIAPQMDVLGRNSPLTQKKDPLLAIVKDTLKPSLKSIADVPTSCQRSSSPVVVTSNREAGSEFVRQTNSKAIDDTIRENPSRSIVPQKNNLFGAIAEDTLQPINTFAKGLHLCQPSSFGNVVTFSSSDFTRRTDPTDNAIPKSNPSPPCSPPKGSSFPPVDDGINAVFKTRLDGLQLPQSSTSPDALTSNTSVCSDFTRRTNTMALGNDSLRKSNLCATLPTSVTEFSRRSHTEAEKGLQSGNPLEEARKKLAALRGDTPLASNRNDPRGKKHNYTSSTAVSAATLLPKTDSSKAMWPRTDISPSRAGDTTSVSIPMTNVHAPLNLNLNLNQRPIPRSADLQSPNTPLSVQPLIPVRTYAAPTVSPTTDMPAFSGSVDTPSETRRDPRLSNKYATDPRFQNKSYNEFQKTIWNSNGYGNAQNRSGPGSTLNPLSRLGSGSYHDNDSLNRFHDQVPRTYREHREAKARAEAAEALEQHRQFLVDLKRQEEADKKRQLQAAEKRRDIEVTKVNESVAVAAVSEIQLDTSYRNCDFVGAPTKKIDFRIPKKAITQKSSTDHEHFKDTADDHKKTNDNFRLKKVITQKSSTDHEHFKDNANDDHQKTNDKGCVDIRGSDKIHRKLALKSSESGNIHSFNMENEPPLASSPPDEVALSDLAVNENNHKEKNEKSEKAKTSDKSKKRRKCHSSSEFGKQAKEVGKDNKVDNQQDKKDDQNDHIDMKKTEKRQQSPQPKLTTKIKIVGLTGPSPQTKMVINREEANVSEDRQIGKEEKNGTVIKSQISSKSRILKRRNTMGPTSSVPLIDKHKLFSNCSLLFEDVEGLQKATSDNIIQLPQSIDDNSFDKSTDYCSVSTQNIISGKRRTRVTEIKDDSTPTVSRIVKRRNTMAPIARSESLVDENELFTNCSPLFINVRDRQVSSTENNIHVQSIDNSFDEANGITERRSTQVADSTEVSAPTALRIVKRRNTMAPIASEPLIDKKELFTNSSLLYEDMQERQKERNDKGLQRARSIASLFEKTIDNCTVSTQNIITGKRRTRGSEVSFNETLLSRKSFKMGPITITKTKPDVKSKVNNSQEAPTEVILTKEAAKDMGKNPSTSIKRKRGRSCNKKSLATAKKPCLNFKIDINSSNSVEVNKDVVINKVQHGKSTTSQSDVNTRATKTRRPKRNELDKLNEDIAQMYYGEEVMRASGRRACTIQHQQLVTSDVFTVTPTPESPPLHSTTNVERAIKNVARRGVPFFKGPRTSTDGCNRTSFFIKQCRVSLQRIKPPQLIQSSKKSKNPYKPNETNQTANNRGILNINPYWHALSSVMSQCVICEKAIKKANSVLHYMQFHGEPFGARLAPGMLEKVRQNRGNHPVYSLKHPTKPSGDLLYHYTCPFCKHTADLRTSEWYDHLSHHTGELRYQCSKCQRQFNRRYAGQQHAKLCGSDAEIISNESYTNRVPIIVHVCQLCEFVQKSEINLLKHLQNQHGIKDLEENNTVNELIETIQLFRFDSVAESISENNSMGNSRTKPKTNSHLKSNRGGIKNRKKMPKKRFRIMARKAIKLVKAEDLQQINKVEKKVKEVEGQDLINNDCMVAVPLSPGTSKKYLPLVFNECKSSDTHEEDLEKTDQAIDADVKVLSQDSELEPSATKASKPITIIELQDDYDNLSGIGSDVSYEDNQNVSENNLHDEENENKKMNVSTDEWVDFESVNRHSKSKSIFTKFNRFCTRLKKNGELSARTKSVRSIASSSNSESSDLTLNDPVELMPKMTALEPPALLGTCISTNLAPTPPTRVENVGFRRGAYYCFYPNCAFLYSNEVEGLEIHFASDHPSVRWSGNCLACQEINKPLDVSCSNLTIEQELLHMVRKHMDKTSLSPASNNEVEKSTPARVTPKLRVRRFSGDRLVPEVEKELNIGKINNNTMLKDLLNSSPRPPNQQTIDFHAAGLGEFLTTKNLHHQEPVLVNHTSGLGLSISKVFSLAPTQTPLNTGDFIVTQSSPSKNFGDQTPAQINISMKPTTPAKVPILNSASASIGLVADRFRCMAPKCGYCAHTVMCIREHMKFHSFSFGNNDYLKCAYCRHVGADVKDYVHHGVTVHGLASLIELEPESAPINPTVTETHAEISVAQQIRDVLNQRNRQPTTTPSEISAPPCSSMTAINAQATEISMGPTPPPVSSVVAELLRPTGFSEDKLYACPYKGCSSVSLNVKVFVSHIRFHIASTHNQDAEVKCKYCNICLKPTELRNHLQKFHGKHTVFCAVCLATTLNRRLMHYHVKTKHEAIFLLANRQLHFLQLPSDSTEENIELAAIEHPFGKKQLEDFHKRLIDEWLKRQQNTKIYYRHSELGLLSKIPSITQLLRCADCNKFETLERKQMQIHLNKHKSEEIANAYQTEKSAVTTLFSVDDPRKLDHHVNQLNHEAEPLQPGQHQIIVPKLVYVPNEKLYHCGHTKCLQSMSTELALRQHLSTEHSYKDEMSCIHCKTTFSNKSTTEAHIEHLELHKQYVYQCGGCSRFSHKRALIERHIQERHQHSDVDVVIYRRDKIGDAMSSAKWLKAPKSSQLEYICNLCQHMFPSAAQIVNHALTVHKKKYQYYCQHCSADFDDPIPLIRHLLAEHPGHPVELVQVFQRLSVKSKHTLGFYCLNCHEVLNTRQKVSGHCELKHECRYQFKCAHCPYGHSLERNVANHMLEKHPFALGRAIMQFERVSNNLPDDVCWAYLGRTIEVPSATTIKDQHQQERQQPIIVDEIELISSSDEETISVESDNFKSIEFACSYCHETSNDVMELREKHWVDTHADRPFYFRVQPQLLCPECKQFTGNAKTLLEKHLVTVHGIRSIVACDMRRPEECAFCDYRYVSWQDLAQHINDVGHRANDLKNVTDADLHALRQLGTKGATTVNEYYQCIICKVIMPTCLAMGQHGRIQHSDAENFCFRRLTDDVVYHCFNCMYASTEEIETLRHMLDHYPKYQQCRFCHGEELAISTFDACVQHRAAHPYAELKMYLMEIYYQFQNGLIITKSSLRRTKFFDESLIRTLDMELMHGRRPRDIPQPLAKRRKTVNTEQIIGPFSKLDTPANTERRTKSINTTLVTSFTGSDATAASSSITANFPIRILKRRFTVVGHHVYTEPKSQEN